MSSSPLQRTHDIMSALAGLADRMDLALRKSDLDKIARLKVENVPAISDEMAEKIRRADTLTLKNLDDIRRSRAMHNIVAIKHRQ